MIITTNYLKKLNEKNGGDDAEVTTADIIAFVIILVIELSIMVQCVRNAILISRPGLERFVNILVAIILPIPYFFFSMFLVKMKMG
jgi:hypothetical protein